MERTGDTSGYVYFVQQSGGGPIKIGFARDVVKRLDHLTSANPGELAILAIMPGGIPMERRLHAEFAEHRIRGEWFKPHASILAFIASVPKALLRELKYRRRQGALRTPLATAREIWADASLGYRQARAMLVGWTQRRIAAELGARSMPRQGHDPDKAREYGSRGGRPRIDRGVADEDAQREWFDMRHATNGAALKHMGKFNETTAQRRFGPSGRVTGPRRKIKSKPKARS